MTLTSNSENFYFLPNSVLNFRKSYQIWGEIGSRTKMLQAKNKLWVEPPPPQPVLIRLKMMMPNNKRFTNRVTRSVLEIRSPHF